MRFNIGDLIYIKHRPELIYIVDDVWDEGTLKQITLHKNLNYPDEVGNEYICEDPYEWDNMPWELYEVSSDPDVLSPYYKVIRKVKQMYKRREEDGYAF